MRGLQLTNRNNPRSLVNFYNLMDDFFNDSFNYGLSRRFKAFKLDVIEKGNSYFVEAELPGINKENIDLDYDNNMLTIRVSQEEKKEETKEENKKYIYKERESLSMIRTIRLDDVDADKIEAELDDGILKIKAPILKNIKKKKTIKIL